MYWYRPPYLTFYYSDSCINRPPPPPPTPLHDLCCQGTHTPFPPTPMYWHEHTLTLSAPLTWPQPTESVHFDEDMHPLHPLPFINTNTLAPMMQPAPHSLDICPLHLCLANWGHAPPSPTYQHKPTCPHNATSPPPPPPNSLDISPLRLSCW